MNRLLCALVGALLYASAPAHAATEIQGVLGGTPMGIAPAALLGQATFTASTSSTAINASLSLAPNSGPFPTATLFGTIKIKVQGTETTGIYVCWQGGACTSAVGEYILPGESATQSLTYLNMTSQPPTVISTGTPKVAVFW